MNWKVPFFDLQLGEEERLAAIEAIESNWLTAGPRIAEFERQFGHRFGEDVQAVAVSSATAALHLSLIALGVGKGDEVILPSLTFVACANAVRYVGATPVFVDIKSPQDWNLSVEDVGRKITPRTKVVMAVHFAGYACDLDTLQALCTERNILLVEDCSHAIGAGWKGRPLGTIGATGCFSFFSNKNMTTGEGGMVVTRDPRVSDRIKILRSHGITSSTYQRFKGHSFGYDVAEVGFNYRLDEIRAAIGIVQLAKLDRNNAERKKRVMHYRERLRECIPGVTVPFASRVAESAFHIFPILLPEGRESRERVIRELAAEGIQCSVHYRPIHTFQAYEHMPAEVPVTDSVSGSIVTLPLYPTMTDTQVDLVVDALARCL